VVVVTVFCSDDFDRPDGPSLGNTETGQPWVAPGWGTVAGRGRKGGSEVNAVVASTDATGTYTVSTTTIPPATGEQLLGPIARWTDTLNFVLLERVLTNTEDAVKLYVRTAGNFVERGIWGGALPVSTGLDPDAVLELAIQVNGNVVLCSVNDVERITYTLTGGEVAALTGTGAGMRDEGSPGYWVDFVVESGTGPAPDPDVWATPAQTRAQWADAPEDDDLLAFLLGVAQEVCEAYAPALAADAAVPARYTRAVVQQLRDVWQNGERDGDVLGYDGEYAIRVRPLTASVKALLRPPTGRPRLYKDAEEES
jgi:hypothetical protein